MCGIAGHLSFSDEIQKDRIINNVDRMCSAIRHRGPDAHGIYTDPSMPLVLGHQRLSIQDIANGDQPMCDQSAKVWITFNGEIYNFKRLRSELEEKGYTFRTRSDTETIINAYLEWGEGCLAHFNGMFAFAIWDSRTNTLFCARDRIGIKPFYYYWDNNNFVFASEVKGIVCNDVVKRRVNHRTLYDYLLASYSPGEETPFEQLKKLPAGHQLIVKDGNIDIKRYWSVLDSCQTDSPHNFSRSAEELTSKLSESVKDCLVSDVPVGAFLSGGLDSSSVVSLMGRHCDQPVATQCIGFEAESFDERSYANEIAVALSTNHAESVVQLDVGKTLDKIVWSMDDLVADASAIPTYHLCSEARKRVKVCLSGDGGDELFAGYNWYAELARLKNIEKYIPEWLFNKAQGNRLFSSLSGNFRGSTFIKNIAQPNQARHTNLMSCFCDEDMAQLLTNRELTETSQINHPVQRLYAEIEREQSLPGHWDGVRTAQLVDLVSYMAECILMKVDKMSMAHSLEVRVPLLDHRVVEYAFQLPTEFKLHAGQRKRVLKKSVEHLVPQKLLNRKKQGFTASLKDWLLHDLHERVGDYLLTGKQSRSGYFKTSEVSKIWNQLEKQSFRIDRSQHLWTLLCFELWHEMYDL